MMIDDDQWFTSEQNVQRFSFLGSKFSTEAISRTNTICMLRVSRKTLFRFVKLFYNIHIDFSPRSILII